MTVEEKKFELKIQVDEKTAEGTYVNFLSVFHNQAEFVMDFGRIVPGKPEVKILSRLMTNPIALKQVVRTLTENLERYEKSFGPIPVEPPGAGPPRGLIQ
jgi:hypothetical protein